MKHGKAIAALIGIVIVAGVILANPDILDQANVSTPIPTGAATNPSGKIQTFAGAIDFDDKLNDALAIGTTYTDSTQADVNYYKLVAGEPQFITQSASGTGTVNVNKGTSKDDPGDTTIWAEVVIPSGQDHLIDAKTMVKDSKVGTPTWCDWNHDQIFTYCFPIDATGFNELATDPRINFIIALFDEGSITLDSPSDVTSPVAGKDDCDIDWELTLSAEGDATYISGASITVNETDTAKLFPAESWIKIAGDQKSFPSATNKGAVSTNYLFQWELAEDYHEPGAKLITFPISGEDTFSFKTRIKTNLAADTGDGFTALLTIEEINAQGATNTVTDTVTCS